MSYLVDEAVDALAQSLPALPLAFLLSGGAPRGLTHHRQLEGRDIHTTGAAAGGRQGGCGRRQAAVATAATAGRRRRQRGHRGRRRGRRLLAIRPRIAPRAALGLLPVFPLAAAPPRTPVGLRAAAAAAAATAATATARRRRALRVGARSRRHDGSLVLTRCTPKSTGSPPCTEGKRQCCRKSKGDENSYVPRRGLGNLKTSFFRREGKPRPKKPVLIHIKNRGTHMRFC